MFCCLKQAMSFPCCQPATQLLLLPACSCRSVSLLLSVMSGAAVSPVFIYLFIFYAIGHRKRVVCAPIMHYMPTAMKAMPCHLPHHCHATVACLPLTVVAHAHATPQASLLFRLPDGGFRGE